MSELSPIDLAALASFLACWLGYTWLAGGRLGGRRSLMARMDEYRRAWMTRMLGRDNRMLDIQVVAVLTRSIAFFASTSLFIVAGLLAVLGAREQAMAVIAELPLAEPGAAATWELKVLLLVVIFVYAFFKFTWALRQFNYVAIIVGGAPPDPATEPSGRDFVERGATIASRAAEHFNRGLRAYYFGLAALSWFVHPILLIGLSVWVVLVLWRREFRSNILRTLGPHGTPLGPP
jgi:uncharacterized membrane protein